MTTESPYQLALDEARRGADQQATALSQLRSNTMSLLAVAAAATTFLGGLIADDRPGWTTLLTSAAVLFTLHVGLALNVVWPHHQWTTADPFELVAWVEVDHAASDVQERDLALHMANNYEDNARTLTSMTTSYCFAVVTLVALIACLAVELVN